MTELPIRPRAAPRTARRSQRVLTAFSGPVVSLLVLLGGCERPDPALIPDATLQAELGLTEDDRVHSILVATDASERARPDSLSVRIGDYVQFVSDDWLVHEVSFDLEAVDADLRAFLEGTDQVASPPLLEQGSRFVLSFREAPPGRYPYRIEGNRGSGLGLIVVEDPDHR